MPFSYAVSSIPNSSLENKTYSIQRKKREISLLRWDLCSYIRVLWNLKTCQECTIYSEWNILSIYPTSCHRGNLSRNKIKSALKSVKHTRNNIRFNRKSRLQILLQILAPFVRNPISRHHDLYASGVDILLSVSINRKLPLMMLMGKFFPHSTNDLVNHSFRDGVLLR